MFAVAPPLHPGVVTAGIAFCALSPLWLILLAVLIHRLLTRLTSPKE